MDSYEITKTICDTVDIITDKKIAQSGFDNTISARIIDNNQSYKNIYRCKYQDSTFYASSLNDAKYNVDDRVLVLVPQNNFSNKKTILGLDKNVALDLEVDDLPIYDIYQTNCFRKSNTYTISTDIDKQHEIAGDNHLCDSRINELVDFETLKQNLLYAGYLAIGGDFMLTLDPTKEASKELPPLTGCRYGLTFTLVFKASNGNLIDEDFSITSNNFEGNPFFMSKPTHQIMFIPLNNIYQLVGVREVRFWQTGFQTTGQGNNLSVSKIWISAANQTDVDNSSFYYVSLLASDGPIFTSESSCQKKLSATIRERDNASTVNFSNVSYYWFKQDVEVFAEGYFGYQKYGGIGWHCLNESYWEIPGTKQSFKTSKKAYCHITPEPRYITPYKCVVVLNEGKDNERTLESEIIEIINRNANTDAYCTITADPDTTELYFGEGDVTLTAHFYTESGGKEEVDISNQPNYRVYWTDAYYFVLQDSAKMFDPSKKMIFEVPKLNANDTTVIFRCFILDTTNTNEFYDHLLSQSYTFTNTQGVPTGKSTLYINNGDQQFSYGATNQVIETPQTLSIKAYDPNGQPIDSALIKNVKWTIPANNSLIQLPSELAKEENLDEEQENYIVSKQDLSFEVKPYQASYINNQIKVQCDYQNITLEQVTSFNFPIDDVDNVNSNQILTEVEVKDKPGPIILYYQDSGLNGKYNYLSDQDPDPLVIQMNIINNKGEKTKCPITNAKLFSVNTLNPNKNNVSCYVKTIKDGEVNLQICSKVTAAATSFYGTVLQVEGMLDGKIVFGYKPIYAVLISSTQNPVNVNITEAIENIRFNWNGYSPEVPVRPVCKINILNHQQLNITYEVVNRDDLFNIDSSGVLTYKINKQFSNVNNMLTIAAYCRDGNAGLCTVYIPINLYLNTFTNAAIEGWDGYSIKLDEENNVLLAPQAGMGKKDENGLFTGVVMGAVKNMGSGSDPEQIGLFGFAHGKKSFFLDADTGRATFGTEDKGTIVLDPDGDCVITCTDPSGGANSGMEINLTKNTISSDFFNIDERGQVTIGNKNVGLVSIQHNDQIAELSIRKANDSAPARITMSSDGEIHTNDILIDSNILHFRTSGDSGEPVVKELSLNALYNLINPQ